MNKPLLKWGDFFKKACLFEASLVLVAVFLGWIADIDPFENFYFSETAIIYGILGTAPLFFMFLTLEKIQGESLVTIRKLLLDSLGPVLHKSHWSDLLMLAAIAGFSEELLFRGILQPWMESAWGLTEGLIISNLIFGLAHAVTPMYAFLAALVGIYLGLSMD
jgi:membrane protease YdiL (CAAX protease family)